MHIHRTLVTCMACCLLTPFPAHSKVPSNRTSRDDSVPLRPHPAKGAGDSSGIRMFTPA